MFSFNSSLKQSTSAFRGMIITVQPPLTEASAITLLLLFSPSQRVLRSGLTSLSYHFTTTQANKQWATKQMCQQHQTSCNFVDLVTPWRGHSSNSQEDKDRMVNTSGVVPSLLQLSLLCCRYGASILWQTLEYFAAKTLTKTDKSPKAASMPLTVAVG